MGNASGDQGENEGQRKKKKKKGQENVIHFLPKTRNSL